MTTANATPRLLAILLLLAAALLVPVAGGMTAALASEIKYVVNGVPITSYDIQRRAAFLRLQRSRDNAGEKMIEQALQEAEIKRLRINIPDRSVDDAYARFASGNKLSLAQLDQIMAQSGVTKSHFKAFIRAQMGWSQALGARFRAENRTSEQDAVQRMLKQGGNKPSATEYMLQQVIFVVPASDKGSGPRRKREADAMRGRFANCNTTREFAKGLIDVTVRDLGRVLAPELPPEWAEAIKAASPGQATPVRQTDRGYEFIGICSAREVSDDRVAQLVFQAEAGGGDRDELSKKYLAELREKARIQKR